MGMNRVLPEPATRAVEAVCAVVTCAACPENFLRVDGKLVCRPHFEKIEDTIAKITSHLMSGCVSDECPWNCEPEEGV
jgi:hypothetical protein